MYIKQNQKNDIFEPLFGLDDVDMALHFLSRAVAGHFEDKIWASYLGNRNCGKGILYDLFAYAFEKYIGPVDLPNFTGVKTVRQRI